jgi:YfiH family protein
MLDLMLDLIRAPNIAAPHGFTTRAGGVSEGPYAGLNLGLSSGDDEARVAENRRRALEAFGTPQHKVCAFHQVHGDRVLVAASSWFEQEADAAVSDTPGLLLVVSTADCLPILFYDPCTGAVGAAHCGWRGTVARLAQRTVAALRARFGCDPADLRVAFGPAIRQPNYHVGPEVALAFREAGFPEEVLIEEGAGFLLDIPAANRWLLLESGVQAANLWDSGLCTYEDRRFYSHRRDKGQTGRQWGVIAAGRKDR